jgi:HPt (histidine-containing phosphotransfer) domain-containing protein
VLETLNDDHAAFKELSEMLLADHKPMLEAARQAVASGNVEELASIAHTLKGMVGNFAAESASKAAQDFYAAAHAGRINKAAAALKRFEQEMAELEQALRADPILANA